MATILLSDMVLVDSLKGVRRGNVLIRDGRIALVEDSSSLDADMCIQGGGHIAVLPGFVNAHTHAAMVLVRGLGEDMALQDWLNKKIWPVEARLEEEHVYWGTSQALLEMASTGTTCFSDMYFFMEEVAQATLDQGLRACLCRGILWDGSQKTPPDALEEQIVLGEKWHGKEGLLKVFYGPHAPYTVSPEHLETIAREANQRGLGIHTHWLETEWEWDHLKEKLHRDPIGLLEETGLFEASHLILAHGVWFPEDRLGEIVRSNLGVVHNPKSNLKLGSGVAPIPSMLAKGVRVALGTDGAASNNRLDMWEEMRFAALLHKGVGRDPTTVSATQAFTMATLGGAETLGYTDLGALEDGFKADLCLVNLDMPHYNGWNEENLLPYLVYAGSSADIEATMVQGRWVWGKHGTSMDAEQILEESGKCRKSLVTP